MRRARPERSRGHNRWGIVLGDLMSHLLVFMIFLCAMEGLLSKPPPRDPPRTRPLPNIAPRRPEPGGRLLFTVAFDRGSDNLTQEATRELHEASPSLWSVPQALLITGYASPTTDAAAEESLDDADRRAFERARVVVKALCGALDGDCMDTNGRPKFFPACGELGNEVAIDEADASRSRDRVDVFTVDQGWP